MFPSPPQSRSDVAMNTRDETLFQASPDTLEIDHRWETQVSRLQCFIFNVQGIANYILMQKTLEYIANIIKHIEIMKPKYRHVPLLRDFMFPYYYEMFRLVK